MAQMYIEDSSTLTTQYFFGGVYESVVETGASKKYYALPKDTGTGVAGQMVAVRSQADANSTPELAYILGDHASTSAPYGDSQHRPGFHVHRIG